MVASASPGIGKAEIGGSLEPRSRETLFQKKKGSPRGAHKKKGNHQIPEMKVKLQLEIHTVASGGPGRGYWAPA